MQGEKQKIDQNALSRQLAVYGHEAQGKLMKMKIFLYGVTGVNVKITQLGIEIAKNLILTGPHQISIFDPNMVTLNDLGRNFYAKEEHVGKATCAQAPSMN